MAQAVPDDARCASGPRDEQRAVPTARAHERDAAPTRVERVTRWGEQGTCHEVPCIKQVNLAPFGNPW